MRIYFVGPRVCVNNDKMKTRRNAKPMLPYGTSAAKKVALGLFQLVALATNIKIPEHQTNSNSNFTEQVMNRFHEVNELYDGTLDELHHLFYETDISSNESFTFSNAMKQDDKLAFVHTIGKEITDHENGGHW